MDHVEYLKRALGPYTQELTHSPLMLFTFATGLITCVSVVLFINVGKAKPVLDPTQFQTYELIKKTELSPNTARYRFALPSKDSMLGLPIGQHIQVQAEVNTKMVQRSYTPVTSDDELGFFDLVIKTYPDGAVSSYVGAMKIGDPLSVKGPKGTMRYHSDLTSHIGMIAGGTGITPCYQIIQQILKDTEDNTTISFIYANATIDDILMKDELDKLSRENNDQFRIRYFLNDPPENWNGGTGFITKECIDEFLPHVNERSKILMCGPPPMINACKKHLDELGFPKPNAVSKPDDQVFCF
ncbi:unnamed protein product [Sympodiomycopsis kandeliae]